MHGKDQLGGSPGEGPRQWTRRDILKLAILVGVGAGAVWRKLQEAPGQPGSPQPSNPTLDDDPDFARNRRHNLHTSEAFARAVNEDILEAAENFWLLFTSPPEGVSVTRSTAQEAVFDGSYVFIGQNYPNSLTVSSQYTIGMALTKQPDFPGSMPKPGDIYGIWGLTSIVHPGGGTDVWCEMSAHRHEKPAGASASDTPRWVISCMQKSKHGDVWVNATLDSGDPNTFGQRGISNPPATPADILAAFNSLAGQVRLPDKPADELNPIGFLPPN